MAGGGFIEREKRYIRKRELEKYFRLMPFEPNVAGVIKALDVVVMPSPLGDLSPFCPWKHSFAVRPLLLLIVLV